MVVGIRDRRFIESFTSGVNADDTVARNRIIESLHEFRRLIGQGEDQETYLCSPHAVHFHIGRPTTGLLYLPCISLSQRINQQCVSQNPWLRLHAWLSLHALGQYSSISYGHGPGIASEMKDKCARDGVNALHSSKVHVGRSEDPPDAGWGLFASALILHINYL